MRSGASLKLTQTSLPPSPPPSVVASPLRPMPKVQWPAVTMTRSLYNLLGTITVRRLLDALLPG